MISLNNLISRLKENIDVLFKIFFDELGISFNDFKNFFDEYLFEIFDIVIIKSDLINV